MNPFQKLSHNTQQRIVAFTTIMFVVVTAIALLWSSLPSKAPLRKSAALAVGQVRVTDADMKKYESWSDREVLQRVCPTFAKKVEDKDMKDQQLAKAAWVACAGHFHREIDTPTTRVDLLKKAVTKGLMRG